MKNEARYTTTKVVWSCGPWPLSAAQLLFRMFQWRCQLSKVFPWIRTSGDAPLFQLLNGSIMSISNLRQRYEKLIRDMNLSLDDYPLYSTKDGGATSYARRRVPFHIIQMLGRWKSDAYKIYIKYSHSDIANIQRNFCFTPVSDSHLVYTCDESLSNYRLS